MASTADRRPYVMLVALAAQGHLNPMLRFASRLASKSVDVTLALTPNAYQQILNARSDHPAGTPIHVADGDHRVRVEIRPFSDGFEPGADRSRDMNLYLDQLAAVGSASLSELIVDLARQGRPVSCLVGNQFTSWVADVAARLGIPCATLWIQSCAVFAAYYRYHHEPSQFQETAGDILKFPTLPPIRFEDLPSLVRPDNPYPFYTRLLNSQFEKMKSYRWVFANSADELERQVIDSMAELQPIKPVGPLVPFALLGRRGTCDVRADLWAAELNCLEWLDGQPDNSVIYVSFGSYLTFPAQQMAELAWGLKNSGTRFMWMVKPKVDDSDSGLPEDFVDEGLDRGRVVPWCPQTDVLRHRAVAGFLTHCGWNSTLETIAAGVPVIAFPSWSDQPTNAKFIVDVYRLGVRLQVGPDGLVSREEVKRCIGEVMAGEAAAEMRQEALRWKDVVTRAAADGGTSDQNIQEFVDDLI
ncbi:gallate 1-beta-glucosyltransferase 84A24-like [Nymphaea colorata]|uniref:gallate 1-beta-glucosyltransferase 84A24-like n=1 Tax=Nymphaea colorata TaxID=210225 RepID=UPI00129EADE9|nr:gallate 1-beta-glucosyltransferase 84A24-like [Nymphaea colorata]